MDGNKYEYGPTAKVPKDLAGWAQWSKLLDERSGLIRHAYTIIENREPITGDPLKRWLQGPAEARLNMLADDGSFAALKLSERARDLKKRMADAQANFTTTLVAKDLPKRRETKLLQRGEYNLPTGDPLQPGVVSVMGSLPQDSAKSRLGLAQWLTSRDHPLVARVLVNRIWQRLFGYGLVRTPEDFGLQGQQPTHPELLDWLAVQFKANGYRIKPLHRLIMKSAAYRRSSSVNASLFNSDPDNRYLTRFSRRRLTAEEIRDSLLVAGRNLDPSLGTSHPFPAEATWTFTQHNPFSAVYETNRRSAYLMVQRQRRHPFLALFDGADPNSSTAARQTTTVPTQALYFLNDPFFHDQAGRFADGVLKDANDDDTRIEQIFHRLFQRPPLQDERSLAKQFLQQHPDQSHERWKAYARVLLASNEFLYLD